MAKVNDKTIVLTLLALFAVIPWISFSYLT